MPNLILYPMFSWIPAFAGMTAFRVFSCRSNKIFLRVSNNVVCTKRAHHVQFACAVHTGHFSAKCFGPFIVLDRITPDGMRTEKAFHWAGMVFRIVFCAFYPYILACPAESGVDPV
jgi:hypothetical protein